MQCQLGLQATLEAVSNHAISIGLVKPKETAYKSILAAGIVAGGPEVWDNVQGNDMLSQLKELKRLLKNKAVGQDCGACRFNTCVVKLSSNYRVPSTKIGLCSSIGSQIGWTIHVAEICMPLAACNADLVRVEITTSLIEHEHVFNACTLLHASLFLMLSSMAPKRIQKFGWRHSPPHLSTTTRRAMQRLVCRQCQRSWTWLCPG